MASSLKDIPIDKDIHHQKFDEILGSLTEDQRQAVYQQCGDWDKFLRINNPAIWNMAVSNIGQGLRLAIIASELDGLWQQLHASQSTESSQKRPRPSDVETAPTTVLTTETLKLEPYSMKPWEFTARLTVNDEAPDSESSGDRDRAGTIGTGGVYLYPVNNVVVIITANHNLYGSLIPRSITLKKHQPGTIPALYAVMISKDSSKMYRAELEQSDVIQALSGNKTTDPDMTAQSRSLIELAQKLKSSPASSSAAAASSSSNVPLIPSPFNEFLAAYDLAVLRIKTDGKSLLEYCTPLPFYPSGLSAEFSDRVLCCGFPMAVDEETWQAAKPGITIVDGHIIHRSMLAQCIATPTESPTTPVSAISISSTSVTPVSEDGRIRSASEATAPSTVHLSPSEPAVEDVNMEEAGEELKPPKHIRHVLASYPAQANLSGAPVLLMTPRQRPEGVCYNLSAVGVHLGIIHETVVTVRGKKKPHPASAFAFYVPFEPLRTYLDHLITQ